MVWYLLLTAAASSGVFLAGLFFKGLNSSSSNSFSKASSSLLRIRRSSKLTFKSISSFNDTSSTFLSRFGKNSLRLFPTTPGIDSALAFIVSRSSYSFSHFAAVFWPTFGTPGILSEESPTKANISLIWLGLTPNFSKTFASSKFWCVIVFMVVVWGSSTNCIISLSKVETTDVYFLSFAILTNVAITSSASTPLISNKGNPIALHISLTGFNCSLSSSGIGGLLDL